MSLTDQRTPTDVTRDSPFELADDEYHVPTTDAANWAETSWWSFNVPSRRLGGWLHATYHTNRDCVTWRVFVWDERASDNAKLAYFRIAHDKPMPPSPDLRDITFPGGGFSIKMLEPAAHYAVSYADDDAGFAIDLDFRGVHPPRRYTPGEPPAMFSPHFDQLCHATGTVTLDGETIPVDCYSIRDRTWGPRGPLPTPAKAEGDAAASTPIPAPRPALTEPGTRVKHPGGPRWREVERERGRGRIQYVFGHAEDRTGFLGFVRVSDGDAEGWLPLNVGWLLRDGQFQHLDKTRSRMRNYRTPSTGWNSHYEVELVDIDGRTLRAEGIALSYQSENGAGNNALVRWDLGGEIGWGEDQDIWHPRHFKRMLRELRGLR